jgi:hypothetical protein
MTKTFDALMKVLDEKGEIPDEMAKELITEHGALTDDEKKQLAAAIKMKKALTKPAGQKDEKSGDRKDDKAAVEDVSMDYYLQALSVMDAEGATEDEKKQAKAVIEKFESQ